MLGSLQMPTWSSSLAWDGSRRLHSWELKCRGGKCSLEQGQKLDQTFRRLGSYDEHERQEIPYQDVLCLFSENLGLTSVLQLLQDPSRWTMLRSACLQHLLRYLLSISSFSLFLPVMFFSQVILVVRVVNFRNMGNVFQTLKNFLASLAAGCEIIWQGCFHFSWPWRIWRIPQMHF